jgi:hypothetical protein
MGFSRSSFVVSETVFMPLNHSSPSLGRSCFYVKVSLLWDSSASIVSSRVLVPFGYFAVLIHVTLLSCWFDMIFFEEERSYSFVVFCFLKVSSEADDVILFLEVFLELCTVLRDVWLGFLEFFGVVVFQASPVLSFFIASFFAEVDGLFFCSLFYPVPVLCWVVAASGSFCFYEGVFHQFAVFTFF